MIDRKTLIKEIKKVALLKGDFVLRSGQHSSVYFDKYLFESNPQLLQTICFYLKPLIPSDTQVLAGLNMGGIPLAVALSLETNIPSVFVRKKAKDYGTKKITEGCSIKDKKVCVIEDVITTGGQVVESVQNIRKDKAIVEQVICVINRGSIEAVDRLKKKANLNLNSLLTWDDFQ